MVIDLTQDSDSDSQNRPKTLAANGNHVHPLRPAFVSSLTQRSSVPLKRKPGSLEKPPAFSTSPFSQANFTGFSNEQTDSDHSASHPSHFFQTPSQHLQSFVQLNYQTPTGTQNKRPQIASTNGVHQNSHGSAYYQPSLLSQRQVQPSTPSPGPASQDEQNKITVVVPSPSHQLKREIAMANWAKPDRGPTGLSQEYYPTNAYEKRALKGAYLISKKVNRAEIPFEIGSPGPFLTSPPKINRQLQLSLQRKLSVINGPAVTFAAATDQKSLAQFENFEFINSNKLRKGVQPVSDEFHFGCSCKTVCDPGRCTCLETEEGDSKQTIIPYERAKDDARLMVLTPDFMKRNIMISECGKRCDCNERGCWNHVVQNGRQVRLEIFPTGDRGFGLRSPDPIRAGQFIDCYLGEVITKDVADVREELCMNKHGHSYLFGLDWFDTVSEEDMFVVDGQKFGAPTRFMNHSCNPNCRMFPVTRNNADQRLYDLAFFSLKEIPPMTELTFDYNPGAERVDDVDADSQVVPCLCGESNCRGQLWPNQRKGTR